MFNEIFVNGCYSFMKTKTKNPFIIDCGANIGMSILWFKMAYPKAKILAFEPSSAFKYLKKNIEHLKKIKIRKEALGMREEKSFIYEEKGKEGSLLTSKSTERLVDFKGKLSKQVKAKFVKLSKFIDEKHPVDLLKMDIEGGEYEVINDLWSAEKLKHIDNMIIEFHNDSENPGELTTMLSKLQSYTAKFKVWFAAEKKTGKKMQDILLYCRRIKHV